MKKTRTFTMVELLAVIAIIAILVSLLLPAVITGKKKALATKARADVTSIASAIAQFEATYGYLPYTGSSSPTTDQSYGNYDTFIEILTAQETVTDPLNSRGIPFLSIDSTDGASLVDPWGQNYNMMLDYNYDGEVTVGGDTITGKTAVWSCGPDRNDDNGGGDDITNWD